MFIIRCTTDINIPLFSKIESQLRTNQQGLVVAVELGNAVVDTILGVTVATRDVLIFISLEAEVSILALSMRWTCEHE